MMHGLVVDARRRRNLIAADQFVSLVRRKLSGDRGGDETMQPLLPTIELTH
ncbi:hypothetical protein PP713_11610 [Mycobacterium sp. CSUR Q5927]|nr:hypothetical protein [Mycobacterium sp. CSUR Q5927]